MMPYKITLILLFGIILQVSAQSNPERFRVGITAALDNNLSSESFAFTEYTGYGADYNKTNYRVGLNVEYDLKKKITLNTAVYYSNKDFIGTYYCAVCDFIVFPQPQTIELQFIEVPVTLRYYVLPEQWKPYVEIGVNNLFASKKGVVNDAYKEETIDNSYTLGLKLGGGIEYEINPRFAIRLLADYNKGLTKLIDKSGFKMDYWGIGIGVLTRL